LLESICLNKHKDIGSMKICFSIVAVAGLSFIVSRHHAHAFAVSLTKKKQQSSSPRCVALNAKDQKEGGGDAELNPVTKASWFAVEAFGKVFGSKKAGAQQEVNTGSSYSLDAPPKSLKETKARIQEDNKREYFLSGTVDKLIYDENCEFADPFVSFKGRDRFVENLENLGSFITKYSAKPLGSFDVDEDGLAVTTKFMVKLELGRLPWKPVLAWPWGVRCEIDSNTNLIVLHQESWDIDAWEGVKQIFRAPTTQVN
jgi:Uncharacterized conserved protein (DUF2358)